MKASTLLSALMIVALSIATSTAVRAQAQPAADAQFEVVVNADGVAVRAVGQNAIDLLYPASPAEVAQRRACNRQAGALFAGLVAGGNDRLATVVGGNDPAQGVIDIRTMLALHSDAYGPMNHFEVLGSAPRPWGGDYTFVRARFGNETVAFRLVWKGERLLAFYPGSPEHIKGRLVPEVETNAIVAR